jgi:hypothetical protein
MTALATIPSQCLATRQVAHPSAGSASTCGSRHAHSTLPNANTDARSTITHPAAVAVLMCRTSGQNPVVSEKW